MKRSLQEVVELVVFGLVALLIGTGLLWVVGWLLSLGGLLLKAVAGLLWLLLRFVVPVAIVAGLVYFLVKALQGRHGNAASVPAPAAGGPQSAAVAPASASPEPTAAPEPGAAEASPEAGAAGSGVADTAAGADAQPEGSASPEGDEDAGS